MRFGVSKRIFGFQSVPSRVLGVSSNNIKGSKAKIWKIWVNIRFICTLFYFWPQACLWGPRNLVCNFSILNALLNKLKDWSWFWRYKSTFQIEFIKHESSYRQIFISSYLYFLKFWTSYRQQKSSRHKITRLKKKIEFFYRRNIYI